MRFLRFLLITILGTIVLSAIFVARPSREKIQAICAPCVTGESCSCPMIDGGWHLQVHEWIGEKGIRPVPLSQWQSAISGSATELATVFIITAIIAAVLTYGTKRPT